MLDWWPKVGQRTATMVSVITPTVREAGLAIVEKALKRQLFQDFEWIIQRRETDLPADCVWTLNRDYNKAISKAKGNLIVSWQDFTYAKPDTLEKFWFHYEQEPKTLVTAIGNKYTDETWQVETWRDPRQRLDQGSYYPCYFNDIEWNLCACPYTALAAVGGFDEGLDVHYGMDGYSVCDRLNLIGGFDFYIDQTIKSFSLEHARPQDWEEKNWIRDGRYQQYRKKYLADPTLDYL